MAGISVKQRIEAPIAKVFAVASDFENAAKHISAIKRVEMLTPGKVGVGTKFKETRIMFKKEATETMEVLAFEPNKSYTLGATSCGTEYRSSFQFTPSGTGTDVEFRFEAKPLTFMAKVMGFVFSFMIKSCVKMVEKDLLEVKAHCEGKSAAAVS